MKKEKHQFQLDGNCQIWIEVNDNGSDKSRVAEENPQFFNKTRDLGEAVRAIRPLVDKVMEPLKSLEHRPSRTELQFGFSVGSKAELILNQDQRESHIRVNLVFENQD